MPDPAPGCLSRDPCIWCGASRDDQTHIRFYTADGDPICEKCSVVEYGPLRGDDRTEDGDDDR